VSNGSSCDSRVRMQRSSLQWLTISLLVLFLLNCGLRAERQGIPSEVEATIASISDDIAAEHYEKLYEEAADLWRQDSTLEQSNSVLMMIRTKLGKVENRTLHSAVDQQNSGGPLKGHAFIVTYETKFERGEGMETFTLIERDHQWLLARYRVSSTALN